MFFWLKKLIGYWLMPVPFCLALLVSGAVLAHATRRVRLGRGMMVAATLLLLLFSNKFVSASLVRPLELRYPALPALSAGSPPPAELAACRYIVVLGAGHGFNARRPDLSLLSPSALARLTEAVRLARLSPQAQLIFSGPPTGDQPSHASVMAGAAVSLGLDPARVLLIEDVRDTEDEAQAIRKKIGAVPVALVTSAWHLPRAIALFRHAGLDPLPCPTDFTARDEGTLGWRGFLWDVDSLERSTWAVRERIGLLWISLRGIN